ncbi:hypothetical protein KDL01_08950 [Actinospica durhamensis]|uniref:Uncharacterized protein n=1 Tax=Actinospica durhamensis TaxID=1508375 RepID=A0A941ELM1_9ACTN|nr:hypothetical protein [Actinospica durhamensis]MBR7833391.1 hypothetical protein [Actinospica durhamensis]
MQSALDLTAQTEAFLDCLRVRRDPAADARALPDLLGTLSWTNDDNGHALELVRERWLREGDLDRTELAFAMDDVFPGRTRAEILMNLTAATRRFPQFDEKARVILEHWDARARPAADQVLDQVQESDAAFRELAWDPLPPMSVVEAMEFIVDHPAPNAPPTYLAEIVDELLPCLTAQAQAEIHVVCDDWAAGADAWRAAIVEALLRIRLDRQNA